MAAVSVASSTSLSLSLPSSRQKGDVADGRCDQDTFNDHLVADERGTELCHQLQPPADRGGAGRPGSHQGGAVAGPVDRFVRQRQVVVRAEKNSSKGGRRMTRLFGR